MKLIKLVVLVVIMVFVLLVVGVDILIFVLINLEQYLINVYFVEWIGNMNEVVGGVVEVDICYGLILVNYINFYDCVVDGVVDILWGVIVFNLGKFINLLVMMILFFVELLVQGFYVVC